eukprot:4144098-Pyramimonas_sp.AAC.1
MAQRKSTRGSFYRPPQGRVRLRLGAARQQTWEPTDARRKRTGLARDDIARRLTRAASAASHI